MPVRRSVQVFAACFFMLCTLALDSRDGSPSSGGFRGGQAYAGVFPSCGEEPLQQEDCALAWEERVISEEELESLAQRDPDMSPTVARGILARLNVRARYYIAEDIKAKRALKVPLDFHRYKSWTPMPARLPEVGHLLKFVIIIKNIPFLGWYEHGNLVGDAEVCIGKSWGSTKSGVYRVDNKIIDAVSLKYKNAFGEPAPMPWAMRIYEHVWVHAGDISSGYCSHGCINLPLHPAKALFEWADTNTVVAVVESLEQIPAFFKTHRSNGLLFPGSPQRPRLLAPSLPSTGDKQGVEPRLFRVPSMNSATSRAPP